MYGPIAFKTVLKTKQNKHCIQIYVSIIEVSILRKLNRSKVVNFWLTLYSYKLIIQTNFNLLAYKLLYYIIGKKKNK